MAFTPSQRPTREAPLLILSGALVATICYPLRILLSMLATEGSTWTPTLERAGRLFLGPEQIACYVCFSWASFILLSRYWEVRRQRRSFRLDLLPTDEGARILPEDARPLQRKVEQVASRGGPYILTNLIRLALGKYAVSRSGQDVVETVRMQADVDLGRLVTGMATVHYLAWAIPALGFLGTVRGLALSLSMAGKVDESLEVFLTQATAHLNTAFDCTLIALALSLPVMFLIHAIQRDEESLVIDCQQYCLEHLVNRLCEAEPLPDDAAHPHPTFTARARISR
jgi:biopolymer transport protein ExbB/TolQ